MNSAAGLVRAFYEEVWNRADEARAREILSDALAFRGSLGSDRSGADGFIAYLREIHGALGDYRCTIEDMIAAGQRVAARVRFEGVHRGPLLGIAATGRLVGWRGAAFFTIAAGRIAEIWVLGDVEALRRQLSARD
jgi:steroid delta-isomerase-like uncharacterized protein